MNECKIDKMFDEVVSQFLTKYLKKYVKTIKSDQMVTEIWKGHATLDNVELLPTALTSQNIPFRVVKGVIKHVTVHFPWQNLKNEACVIEVNDVHLLLEPDPETLIKREVQAEMSAIHTSAKEVTKEQERGAWQGLINTVIDNARVDISEIHVRIHFETDTGLKAFCLLIDQLTLVTVDDHDQVLEKVSQGANIVRKRLELSRMSLYFDAEVTDDVDLDEGFLDSMSELMDTGAHQLLMEPFSVRCSLVHTRNDPNVLRNVLNIETDTLVLALTYEQCKALFELQRLLEKWTSRAKYAGCARPKDKAGEVPWWMYVHRCAVQRNRPNEFKPKMALDILRNRANYTEWLETKMDKSVPHPFVEMKMKKLEGEIGETATLFLKRYAQARLKKKMDKDGITAMDVTQLKGLIKTTDLFFDSSSFSARIEVPLFSFELMKDEGTLVSLKVIEIGSSLVRQKKGADFQFAIKNVEIDSNVGGEKKLLKVESEEDWLKITSVVPSTAEPIEVEATVQPIKIEVDLETVQGVVAFFEGETSEDGKSVVEERGGEQKVVLYDVADQMSRLLKFRNQDVKFCFKGLSLFYPFMHEGELKKLTFSIHDVELVKNASSIVVTIVDKLTLDFRLHFVIDDLTIGDISLFKQSTFDLTLNPTYFADTDFVELEMSVALGKLQMHFNEEVERLLLSAKQGLSIFKLSSMKKKPSKERTKTVISYAKLGCKCQIEVGGMNAVLSDLDWRLDVHDLKGVYDIVRSINTAHFSFGEIVLTEKEKKTLYLPNDMTTVDVTQANVHAPLIWNVRVMEPNMFLDLVWLKAFLAKIKQFMKSLSTTDPKDETKKPAKETSHEAKPTRFFLSLEKPIFELPDQHGNFILKCGAFRMGDTYELVEWTFYKDGNLIVKPFTLSYRAEHNYSIATVDELDMQLDPAFFNAVFRIYDYVMHFFSSGKGHSEDYQSVMDVVINIVKITMKLDNETIGSALAKDVNMKFTSTNEGSKGTIAIAQFNATQKLEDNVFPFVTAEQGILFDIRTTRERNAFVYTMNGADIYLSPKTYRYVAALCVDDTIVDTAKKQPGKDSSHTVILAPVNCVLLEGNEKVLSMNFEDLRLIVSYTHVPGRTLCKYVVSLKNLVASSSLMSGEPYDVIRIPETLELAITEKVMSLSVGEILLSANYLLYLKIISSVRALFASPDNESKDPPKSSSASGPKLKLNYRVSVAKLVLDVVPIELRGQHCHFTIDSIQMAVKCAQKVGCVSVREISCDVQNAIPSRSLCVSNVTALCSLDGNEITVSVDDVLAMEDVELKDSLVLKTVSFTANVANITVNYSHDFACAIILCFIPKDVELAHEELMVTEDAVDDDSQEQIPLDPQLERPLELNNYRPSCPKFSLPAEPTTEEGEPIEVIPEDRLKVSGKVGLGRFNLILFCVNKLGSLAIEDVAASYENGGWEAEIQKVEVYPANVDCQKHGLLTKLSDEPLAHFTFKGGMANLVLSPIICKVEYMMYITAMNYMLQTPFLHIPSIQKHQPATEDSKITLPFELHVQCSKWEIVVPTSNTTENEPELIINLTMGVKLTRTDLALIVRDFAVHYHDTDTDVHHPEMVNIRYLSFEREIKGNNAASFKLLLAQEENPQRWGKQAPIVVSVSAVDFVLLKNITEGMKAAAQMIVFSTDNARSGEPKKSSGITEFECRTAEFRLVICSDNRSTSRFIPLFSLVIPPIYAKLIRTENVGTVEVKFEPYVTYYNETTGNWDMIVEPVKVHVRAMVTEEELSLNVDLNNGLNINLPMKAVIQYLDLKSVIEKSLVRHDSRYSEMPKFWIKSNLPGETVFRMLNEDGDYYVLGNGQMAPVFNIDIQTEIRVESRKDDEVKVHVICPEYLVFPTFLSHQIVACRKPYKGGLLILFQTPFQLRNLLSIEIDVFQRRGDSFPLITTLKPNDEWPLYLNSTDKNEFLFAQHNAQSKMKHIVVKLARNMTEPKYVGLEVNGRKVEILITFEIDSSSATKYINLIAPVIGVSLLPVPLHVKVGDMESIVLDQEKECDLIAVRRNDKEFSASFSIDPIQFPKPEKIVLLSPKLRKAPLYNPLVTDKGMVAVFSEQDDVTNQITLSFFVPCVMFNITNETIRIVESGCRRPLEAQIASTSFLLWCPLSYFDKNDSLSIDISVEGQTNVYQKFEVLESKSETIFLELIDEKDSYYPLHIDVSLKSRISVVTITPLLVVHNLLNVSFALQPVKDIPNAYGKDAEEKGLRYKATVTGSPTFIPQGESVQITKMTQSGAFMISIFGYSTTPVICLLLEQKMVFKIQSQTTFMLIELEVVNCGTQFSVYIRETAFPTPVLIENCLDASIEAYQMVSMNPFRIDPHTTSLFAYDEPFGYPAVHLNFCDQHLYVSLLEETGYVKTNAQVGGKDVYVAVEKTRRGSKALVITTERTTVEDDHTTSLSLRVSGISVSAIDMEMREIALVSFDEVKTIIDYRNSGILLRASIKAVQIDDQSIKSKHPVVLAGKPHGKDTPFLRVSCVMPSDVPLFSTVEYASVEIQRIDIDLDATFVSDIYHITTDILKPIKQVVSPRAMSNRHDNTSKVVSFTWLEMTPIFAWLKFRKNTGRPGVRKMLKYLKYVPAINGKMLLPGVIITQITDTVKATSDKIVGEYKTAAFRQLISILGGGGKLMTAFGVTATVAQMLGIQMESELSDEIKKFSRHESEVFDNRKELSGPFSQETLTALANLTRAHPIPNSAFIAGLLQNADIGLRTKQAGQGVIGLLSKTKADSVVKDAGHMEGATRVRLPRAFLNNELDVYDAQLSKAQSCIQQTHIDERIRMEGAACDGKFCVTDLYVYLLDDRLESIQRVIPIKDVEDMDSQNTKNLVMKVKGDDIALVMYLPDEASMMKVRHFIRSQSVMFDIFGESVI